MVTQSVSVGEIFQEAGQLVAKHLVLLGGVLVAISAAYVTVDWFSAQSADQSGSVLLSAISGLVVTLFVQYVVTEQLLADRRPEGQSRGSRHYGSLFLAGLISGLAIVVGALFLILPGIYLAGRWLTYSAQLIDRELGATEALSASWKASENSQVAFSIAAAAAFVPVGVMLGATAIGPSEYLLTDALSALVVVDSLSALTSLASWTLGVAAYRLAVPIDDRLGEVFD